MKCGRSRTASPRGPGCRRTSRLLIGYLEKTIKAKEHRSKAEALALNPKIIKGEGVATDRAPNSKQARAHDRPLRKARQQ